MKSTAEKIKYYKKLRDNFQNQYSYYHDEANFYDRLTLCGGATPFKVLRYDIASYYYYIVRSLTESKISKLKVKEKKEKYKR